MQAARTTPNRKGLLAALYLAGCACPLLAETPVHQSSSLKPGFAVLDQFSDSVQALSARVAPCVVQISVSRFASREENNNGRTGVVLGKQQGVGSGVVVDPDGYIVTNAHVVAGAHRIRVSMVAPVQDAATPDQLITDELARPFLAPVDATLVGVFKEADLALLKIPVSGLTALPFADYRRLRQGQVVFAFGSREGLSNSVSMGVVSSIARQPDPDSPFIYIQTDAPINPGDSGGPLINTAGEIVGLNTFILSQSGGSEGIGFAIPSPLIRIVSDQLRKHGHFHRVVMGAGVQTITPVLAAALQLSRQSGLMVSDVAPGSPAESAGLMLNDVVLALDGARVTNLPQFMMASLTHPAGEPVHLQVLRRSESLLLNVEAVEEAHTSDRLIDFVDPVKSQIAAIGVMGIDIDRRTQPILPKLRGAYGVFVAGRSETPGAISTGLQIGDVIHEVNGVMVATVEALREKLNLMKPGDPVALFIERDSKLLYLAFQLD